MLEFLPSETVMTAQPEPVCSQCAIFSDGGVGLGGGVEGGFIPLNSEKAATITFNALSSSRMDEKLRTRVRVAASHGGARA